jgi:hypothetical protein
VLSSGERPALLEEPTIDELLAEGERTPATTAATP